MEDTDRYGKALEMRVKDLEKELGDVKIKLGVQEEHIKAVVELKVAQQEFNKTINELKLEFVQLKTKLQMIAAIPAVLVTVIEVIKVVMGK